MQIQAEYPFLNIDLQYVGHKVKCKTLLQNIVGLTVLGYTDSNWDEFMEIVLEIIILAVLIFVAVELLLLRVELLRSRKDNETHNEDRSSPTVNVNIDLPSTGGHSSVPKVEKEAVETKAELAEVEEAVKLITPPEPEPPPPPPPPPARNFSYAPRNTQSGIAAVKCPVCKSENSSYRTECFSCGAPIR